MESFKNGIENEKEIIKAINGKSLKDLPDNFRIPIKKMYKFSQPDSVVYARKVPNKYGSKSDFELWMGNSYENISVKCGKSPAVHEETFSTFLIFLENLGVSKLTIKILKAYHYNDGTTNGTGTKMRLADFKEKYRKYIAYASKELSQEHIVKAILQRCVIRGRSETRQEINFIYYGDANSGIFVHRYSLRKYCSLLGKREYDSIHFGPFVYVSKIHKRLVDENGNYVQYSQLCWPNIYDDLKIINDKIDEQKYKMK